MRPSNVVFLWVSHHYMKGTQMTYFNLTPDMDGETWVEVTSVTGTAQDFTVVGLLEDDAPSSAERRFIDGYGDMFRLLARYGSLDPRGADHMTCTCKGWVPEDEVRIGAVEAFGTCWQCGEYVSYYGFGA